MGHGWPQFISREEIEKGEGERDDPRGILHDGKLVVTASRICNVMPKSPERFGSGRDDPLARTI